MFRIRRILIPMVVLSMTVAGAAIAAEPTTGTATVALAPASSSVGAAPARVVADAMTPSNVTVTLRDQFNNPVLGLTAANFSITVSGSAIATTITGGANGVYTFAVTDSVAEVVTVNVSAQGVALNPVTITFTPGPVFANNSTATATPLSVTADGTSASTVTVILADANGNAITGAAGSIVVDLGATDAVASAIAESATQGTYTFTVTNTTAESVTVSVTAQGVPLGETPIITFTAGTVNTGNSNIVPTPANNVTAGTASTVVVTLRDTQNNLITNAVVTVADNSTTATSSAVQNNGDGTYTFTVTNTIAETVAVTVTADSTAFPAVNISWVAAITSAANSNVAVDDNEVVVDLP